MDESLLLKAKQHQVELQAEALRLLDKYNVIEILSEYGEVNFVGSYSFGLMVVPDIDIEVYNENIDTKKALEIGAKLFQEIPRLYMSDRTRLPTEEGRPNGVYIGPIIKENGRRWEIDIWALKSRNIEDMHRSKGFEDTEWMNKLTVEQKDHIILFKYMLNQQGRYGTDVSALQIYKAVYEGARTLDDLLSWSINEA